MSSAAVERMSSDPQVFVKMPAKNENRDCCCGFGFGAEKIKNK